jgi:pimeloyl-ACP methyl ester carboxylesterase
MKLWVFGFAFLLITGADGLSVQTASAGQRQNSAEPVSGTPLTIGERLRIKSKRLGEEREIEVYLPASYAGSKQRYPVIYTLDGEGLGSVAANAMQFMTGYSTVPQMPEALVVAVINTDRNRDMPIPQAYGKGGEENFLAFFVDDLIPVIEQRYRTQALRILLGHSQGGLFATYALSARPAVFQWYLAMDAPLAGFTDVKPLMEKVKALVNKTPNYHGRLITIENLYGWRREWGSLMGVAPKGFYGEQVEIMDETHEAMAFKGIYEGLKRLFHDYTPKLISEDKGIYTLPVLEQMYKERSQDYGYPVDIPKQLLLETAAQNTAMQYGAEAVELIKRALALYGESSRTKRLLAEAEAAAKKGRDPRLAGWMNLPAPGVEQMKPFLGAWQMVSERASELISFEVKDGVIRTQYTVTPPGGEPFQMQVQFVQVLEGQTLQWGLRNGRGAGIILRTVKLVNENTLQGTTEPVGIEHAPPPHSITYMRRSGDKKQ